VKEGRREPPLSKQNHHKSQSVPGVYNLYIHICTTVSHSFSRERERERDVVERKERKKE